jgi:hypothetical protein
MTDRTAWSRSLPTAPPVVRGVFLSAAGGGGPFVGRGGPDSDALAVPDERGEKTT